jgi:hypothetical protein
MDRDDLNKLIRIKETVSELSSLIVKPAANHNTSNGAVEQYKNYYGLVQPILLGQDRYSLEFQAFPNRQEISYGKVTVALMAFRSFLDGVIKQETLGSQTAIEEIKKELFIDESKPFLAYKAISDIVNRTTSSFKMVDNYLESTSLDFFSDINTKLRLKLIF